MRATSAYAAGARAAFAGALLHVFATAVSAETPVGRGDYLFVNSMGACGNCHTPRNAALNPIAAQALSGGFAFEDPGVGRVVIPNITPDRETGIGNLTAAQIVDELRNGKRPDGTLIGPPMPIPVYQKLSDGDAAAIAAYLLSVRPVQPQRRAEPVRDPAAAGLRAAVDACRPALARRQGGLRRPTSRPSRIACCAIPRPHRTGPSTMSRAFASGPRAARFRQTRRDRPQPQHHLRSGTWYRQVDQRPDQACHRPRCAPGRHSACRQVPFAWYKRITPADLDAIVAFVRTIPPAR